jgi:hypothetical protein
MSRKPHAEDGFMWVNVLSKKSISPDLELFDEQWNLDRNVRRYVGGEFGPITKTQTEFRVSEAGVLSIFQSEWREENRRFMTGISLRKGDALDLISWLKENLENFK